MNAREEVRRYQKNKKIVIMIMIIVVITISFVCLFIGSSHMTLSECFSALFGNGSSSNVRIIRNIRIPRVLAAIISGAGLSVSGLIMQTNLNNPMASPSTLGVSNAAVFGANLSIIVFSGGFLSTGNNLAGYSVGVNPYATSLIAFIFSTISILFILGLCRIRSFRPGVVVLAGIAIGSVWTAATTILQFYATDVGLSAAVIWTFGDLGRATYKTDIIMAVVVIAGIVYFLLMSWKFNAMLSGDVVASGIGVNVNRFRFVSMLIASVITAVCVSYLGIIGFVGIICPHIVKKLLGQDHRYSIPGAALCGSCLLLLSDTLSRSLGNGSALPVGAVTSMLGAPFFMILILSGKGERKNA